MSIKIFFNIFVMCFLGFAIYFILYLNKKSDTSNTSDKSEIDKLLENVTKLFNNKTNNGVSDTFSQDIVFNSLDDVTKNMMLFLTYALPNINIDKINELLNGYGLNKKAQTIFEENKDLDSLEFIKKFNISNLIDNYSANSFVMNKEANKYLRLYFIIMINFFNLKSQKEQSKGLARNTVVNVNIELDPDFMTNDILGVYYRTISNKGTSIKEAKIVNGSIDKVPDCLTTTKLCKRSVNINEIIPNETLNFMLANIEDINKLNNLLFVKYLFRLNNTTIPDELNTSFTEVYNILSAKDTQRFIRID